jgi:hypothetical protein
MSRIFLCAAALVSLCSVVSADQIYPVSAHAVTNIHTDTMTFTVELSRAPNLLEDQVSIRGYSSESFPNMALAINNGWPLSGDFRIRSDSIAEQFGEEIRTPLLPWSPIEHALIGSQLVIEIPRSFVGWGNGRPMYWFADASRHPDLMDSIRGSHALVAPEPSSVVLAAIGVVLLITHRVRRGHDALANA